MYKFWVPSARPFVCPSTFSSWCNKRQKCVNSGFRPPVRSSVRQHFRRDAIIEVVSVCPSVRQHFMLWRDNSKSFHRTVLKLYTIVLYNKRQKCINSGFRPPVRSSARQHFRLDAITELWCDNSKSFYRTVLKLCTIVLNNKRQKCINSGFRPPVRSSVRQHFRLDAITQKVFIVQFWNFAQLH